jgi:hypothetical protein
MHRGCSIFANMACDEDLLDPQEAEARLDGPATVRSGQTLHHGLLVCNLAGRELTIATNGQVTAVVVDPRTGKVMARR